MKEAVTFYRPNNKARQGTDKERRLSSFYSRENLDKALELGA
jgi:hypothetical protein